MIILYPYISAKNKDILKEYEIYKKIQKDNLLFTN